MQYILGMLPFGPGTVETLTSLQVQVRAALDGAILGAILGSVAFAIRLAFR